MQVSSSLGRGLMRLAAQRPRGICGKWRKQPSHLPDFEGTVGIPFKFSLAKLSEKDLQKWEGKVFHTGNRTAQVGN